MIRRQKWNVIFVMPWLAHYNFQINQKTEKVKITRYLKSSGDQIKENQNSKPKIRKKKKRKGKEKKRERVKKGRKEEE